MKVFPCLEKRAIIEYINNGKLYKGVNYEYCYCT